MTRHDMTCTVMTTMQMDDDASSGAVYHLLMFLLTVMVMVTVTVMVLATFDTDHLFMCMCGN